MLLRCRRRGPFCPAVHSFNIQPSQRDNEKYKKFVRKHEFFHKRQYFIPQLTYTPGASASSLPSGSATSSDRLSQIRGLDIVTLEHVGNPNLLFGQPYSGKTSFFLKLCLSSIRRFGPKHWVRFVEMRELADLVRSLPKRPKSFLHLLAIHLKTTENELKQIFKPQVCPKFKKIIHCGELFLDGFDEISAVERDYFWRIIPQLKCGKGECAIRIWISCRSYVKAALSKVFPEHGHFDIVKYSPEQLVDLTHHYWKHECFPNMGKEKEDRMLIFAKHLHTELKLVMPTFDTGIGCLPMCIELFASLFSHHLSLFLGTGDVDPKIQPKIYFIDLVGKCVMRMIECYCFKLTAASDEDIDLDLADKEFPKVVELYSEYALKTYPFYSYQNDGSVTGTSYKQTVHITEEMHRIGLIVKDNIGSIQFHHGTFGDFLLAKYFEFKSLCPAEKCDPDFDRFYLREVLFEQREGTGILSYYDYFLGQQNPNHSSRFLHRFLVQHYKLGKGQETEWERIKDNGNVLHLAVAQRYNNIARRFLKAFKVEEWPELKKFLMMSVPLEILEGNDIHKITKTSPNSVRNQHVVSSLSILALFGCDGFVEETLDLFLQVFEPEELQLMFNNQGEWSPIHYAATHVNLWFIKEVYGKNFQNSVKIKPGIYSPEGYLPTHLLLTGAWYYYAMKVKDCTLSDYDDLTTLTDADLCGGVRMDRKVKSTGTLGKDGGEGPEGGESSKSCIGAAEKSQDDFRIIVYQDGLMTKDWFGVPGLLQTLHKCIETMVKVGGEDINAFDLTGRTTFLHRAVEEGLLGTTMFLINMEPSLNLSIRNIHGLTPMHQAGSKGFKNIFLCLARHGARLNLRDIKGQSPIGIWRELGEQLYFSRGGPPHTEPEIKFFQCVEGLTTLATMTNAHDPQEMPWKAFLTNTLQNHAEHPVNNNVETSYVVDDSGDLEDNNSQASTEVEYGEEESIEGDQEPIKFDEGQDTEVEDEEDDGEVKEENHRTSTEALNE